MAFPSADNELRLMSTNGTLVHTFVHLTGTSMPIPFDVDLLYNYAVCNYIEKPEWMSLSDYEKSQKAYKEAESKVLFKNVKEYSATALTAIKIISALKVSRWMPAFAGMTTCF